MPCPMTDKAYLFHRTQTDAPSKVKSECSPATLQKAQTWIPAFPGTHLM